MEDFNKMLEDAKKANLSIDQGIKELRKARSIANMQGKSKLTDEQIKDMQDSYDKVMELKKKLDGYNSNK
jgi:hypothetical protein